MAIELQNQIKQDLWRNHLVEIYEKYYSRLKNLMSFQLASLEFVGEKHTQFHRGIHFPEPLVGHMEFADNQLKYERQAINTTVDGLKKQWEALSEDKKREDYWGCVALLKVLEEIRKQLKEMGLEIIIHPNGQLEFLDAEIKIVLKTQEKEPV